MGLVKPSKTTLNEAIGVTYANRRSCGTVLEIYNKTVLAPGEPHDVVGY